MAKTDFQKWPFGVKSGHFRLFLGDLGEKPGDIFRDFRVKKCVFLGKNC